jgi:asparagine synthetase B (glutamine-hydrolysing)
MPDFSGEVCVTYNGEVYNFQELRHEIEAMGDRLSRPLQGMSTFALYDTGLRQLISCT